MSEVLKLARNAVQGGRLVVNVTSSARHTRDVKTMNLEPPTTQMESQGLATSIVGVNANLRERWRFEWSGQTGLRFNCVSIRFAQL